MRKLWYGGYIRNGDLCSLESLFHCLRRMVLFPVWINLYGENVCAKLQEWKEKGYLLLPMSVNVSRNDIFQGSLVDIFSGLIKKYDIDPQYLHLEITESAYAECGNRIVNTIEELRKLGFTIEMDDFGSGYSSLNLLSQMSLDILKLDMKLVKNEMTKSMEKSILNDIISMAHRMNLTIVAEG